jgi:nucleoside-diphosphate-sugar epimerase
MEAVSGDVSLPLLGLIPANYERLSREVTHVVHAAGNVKLNQSLADARHSAVDSLQHVIEFANIGLGQGKLRKLDYLSTIGVAGRRPGVIAEEPLTESRGFHNTYEQAKAEAEALLWDRMQSGLPATIHRPSMIVGDSRTGRIIHYQVFYHLAEFFVGLKTGGVVPDFGNARLDIIPADFVSRAIRHACFHSDATGRILHLCSGPRQSWLMTTLSDRLRGTLPENADLPPLRTVPMDEFQRLLGSWRARAAAAEVGFLKGLPYLLDYLAEDQTFANEKTAEYLHSAGLRVPPVDAYLTRIMRLYWEWKAAQAASAPAT